MFYKKKALSNVVTTVLLISLAVILALIVLFWTLGFFKETIEKDGRKIENLCKETRIDVTHQPYPNGVSLFIKNVGSIPINSVEIREVGNKGVKTTYVNVSLSPGFISSKINYLYSDKNSLKEIVIYPSLLGKVKGKKTHKSFTCLLNSKVIKRQQLSNL